MPDQPNLLISMNYHVDLWGRRGELCPRNLDQWARDLAAIRDLGCHAVCINIVRWEDRDGAPGGGAYDPLESLDRLLDLVAQSGLRAELMCNQWYGTPDKRLRLDDHIIAHGIDRQPLGTLNWHEPAWRTEQLDPYLQALTARYAPRCPAPIYMFGDDLAAAESSYAPRDAARFRGWLERRYLNISALNKAWGTHHADWAQIQPPHVRETWSAFWADWCAARRDWLDDCAADIGKMLRRHDPRKASRLHFSLMGWYLFVDRDSYGGISPRFIEPFDIISTSMNLAEETWPLEDALQWLERCDYAFRTLRPDQCWGINDLPGPRGGRVEDRVDRYPSATRMIAVMDRAMSLGAKFLQYDGYTKSLRQTAVANHQVLKFHPHIARDLKAYFASVNG